MYNIKASPTEVTIVNSLQEPVFSLAVNKSMMVFTAEMLVKFCEQKEKGIKALLSVGSPNGLWFEDQKYTRKLLFAGTMCFGEDVDKFIELAKVNPTLLVAKSRFSLQIQIL